MKKVSILVILLICIYSVNLFAQESVGKTAEYPITFQPGEKIVQAGLGFGMMGVYGDVVIPPISFSVDIAKEMEGFPVSFGGIIGLAKSEYDWSYWTDEYKWTYTYFLLGARAAYHLHGDGADADRRTQHGGQARPAQGRSAQDRGRPDRGAETGTRHHHRSRRQGVPAEQRNLL